MRIFTRLFFYLLFANTFCSLVHAQLAPAFTNQPPYVTSHGSCGFNTGYKKISASNVYTRFNLRMFCSQWNTLATGIPTPYPAPPYIVPGAYASTTSHKVFFLDNMDSSYIQLDYTLPTTGGGIYTMKLTRSEEQCTTCTAHTSYQPSQLLDYLDEFVTDSINEAFPINILTAPLDSSFTIFHGIPDVFGDSISLNLKNILPWGGSQAISNAISTGQNKQIALYYSRIYKYHNYNTINAPDLTNKAIITALKGKQTVWNPGILDKDNDSINVIPLTLRLRNSFFHPNYSGGITWALTALQDSVIDVQYYPGYSATDPFGPGSSYSLDAGTGEITFTPQDTGIYLLAYRIEEYRNGELLGDIMNIRLAYVIDTSIILPNIAGPDNVTGGSYNATTKTMTICPNQPLSFTMKATSPLSDAMIVMTDNMQSQIPASNVTYNGQNTDSVTLTFNWTPTVADIGYHYVYVDAVDTACGPGHLPAHQSRGFKIYVPGFTGVRHPDTTICPGTPITVTGSFGGPYQWAVLPGGDPALPCTTCNSITVTPNKNTTYTFTGTGPVCYRQDTVTVKLLPDFTVHAGVDSLFCNGVPNGYTPGASVTPSGNYYTYLWSPAAGLSNPNILNPNLINPGLNKTYVLTVSDNLGCYTHSDTVALSSITWTTSLTPLADTFCPGDSVQLLATGGQQYTWAPSAGLSCDTCADPVARPAGNVTYTVVITDTASGCKQQHSAVLTQSDIRQRVNAGGNIDAPGGAFQLNGYAPGTFYWSPGKYLEDSTKARTKGQISENTMFVLTANEGGCTATDTITVFMLRCQKIILPNVFSPNGDGRNDRFIFNNTEPLEVLEFSIYNRWGAKVYSETGTSIEGWDGTYKGSPAPTEVYVYRLRLRCDGKEEILQGNVTLLR